MNHNEQYKLWRTKAVNHGVIYDLEQMHGNREEITDAFYRDLEFGTAGLRGIMGAGTNRLNYYTILRATEGVATYMVKHKLTSAVITYDSRLNSRSFAEVTARTLATKGIKVYLTNGCQPTPFVSYLITRLKCDMGINITASHNPSKYNGYKVYNGTGCQILDEQADEIMKNISRVDPFEVKIDSFQWSLQEKRIEYVDTAFVDDFVAVIQSLSLHKADGLNITYTPLNGAGYKMVPRVLNWLNAKVSIVDEQATPDGNFPTCPYPNPEKAEAMALAMQQAIDNNSDIVLGTDPDCDRLGVAVKHNNQMVQLSGNEVGILLTDYVLSNLSKKRDLSGSVCVRTIVSSPLADKIADYYGVETRIVLTGFKYIGEIVNEMIAQRTPNKFLLGWEESCGYLRGTHVKDKDAVVASLLVAEMTAQHKKKGLTLIDKLEEIYAKYGKYHHRLVSYTFSGLSGAERKAQLLKALRSKPFTKINETNVTSMLDYNNGVRDLPKSDVLQFNCDNGTQLIVRPSGTEPLIKCYLTVVGSDEEAATALDNINNQLNSYFAD